MSELTRYHFNDMPLRVIVIDGEPWFVLNDACGFLGISNTRDAADRIDQDCVGQTDVADSRGQSRLTNVVNEAGLYELIFRSDKPEAAAFRRWVTREVLPAIRKTGGYSIKPVSPLDALAAMVETLREQERRTVALEAESKAITSRVEQLEENHDRVTAIGYANLRKMRSDVKYLNKLGRAASRIAQRDGIPVSKVHSVIWGEVHAWPLEVWDEAAGSTPV